MSDYIKQILARETAGLEARITNINTQIEETKRDKARADQEISDSLKRIVSLEADKKELLAQIKELKSYGS